jgi:hypothetical protein
VVDCVRNVEKIVRSSLNVPKVGTTLFFATFCKQYTPFLISKRQTVGQHYGLHNTTYLYTKDVALGVQEICKFSYCFHNYKYNKFILDRMQFLEQRRLKDGRSPQTSHNIDCVLSSLCYIRPCSIWIAWQRSSPMKGELRLRGPNSISKFHHHNINGGAVDDTWRHR